MDYITLEDAEDTLKHLYKKMSKEEQNAFDAILKAAKFPYDTVNITEIESYIDCVEEYYLFSLANLRKSDIYKIQKEADHHFYDLWETFSQRCTQELMSGKLLSIFSEVSENYIAIKLNNKFKIFHKDDVDFLDNWTIIEELEVPFFFTQITIPMLDADNDETSIFELTKLRSLFKKSSAPENKIITTFKIDRE